jgi:hypothetical protein
MSSPSASIGAQPTSMAASPAAKVTAPRALIVGGNFGGKGAEAMMLTVRDAIRARFPDATCGVAVTSVARRQGIFR